jgi:hypothetical protein
MGWCALRLTLLRKGVSILETWLLWVTKHLCDLFLLRVASDDSGSYTVCICNKF